MRWDIPVTAKAPCYKPGHGDCADRHVGCQSQCEKYLEYRAKLDALNEQRRKERAYWEVTVESIYANRHSLKRTAAGRKALAQR